MTIEEQAKQHVMELERMIFEQIVPNLDFLPDIYAHGLKLPLDDANYQKAAELMNIEKISAFIGEIEKLKEHTDSLRKSIPAEIEAILKEQDTFTAARMAGHDLSNLATPILGNLDMYKNIGDVKYLEEGLGYMTLYRALCMSMAYLASGGDDKFVSFVPVDQLQQILRNSVKNRVIRLGKKHPDDITTRELTTLYQIAKNSPTDFLVQISTSGGNDDEGYDHIRTYDWGNGIMYKDANGLIPMSAERIQSVFGDFSTKDDSSNGGLGLRIVKQLTIMAGGDIIVSTTSPEGKTVIYDTFDNAAMEKTIEGQQMGGTNFYVDIPRSELPER